MIGSDLCEEDQRGQEAEGEGHGVWNETGEDHEDQVIDSKQSHVQPQNEHQVNQTAYYAAQLT